MAVISERVGEKEREFNAGEMKFLRAKRDQTQGRGGADPL